MNSCMKKLSQEIHHNEFVNMLLESIGDGVFVLDTSGSIISWNTAMEHVTGYTVKEAVGKGCSLLGVSQCFGKACPNGLAECGILDEGALGPVECLLRHKDGHTVPVIKNARVIKQEDGTVNGIVEAITDLSELHQAKLKVKEATLRLNGLNMFSGIIGKSRAMRNVFAAIKASAESDVAVLIQGESGTGKELVASAVHDSSERSEKHLITVNCSALPDSLLESELFGHVKGAFTGAIRDRIGRFEGADGGTIFLDEIGEISPLMQIKLLRVLQQKEVERVGESIRRKISIRIIAATNKDLYQLVKQGRFREDLYYRLKVFPINLPPLRERKDDIPLLVNHFIDINNKRTGKQIQGISQSAMSIFMNYPWPGNVRELENSIEHAFVLCDGDRIDTLDLPEDVRQIGRQSTFFESYHASKKTSRPGRKITSDTLLALLNECDWNKAEVARRVGMSRASIWKYMKKYDIPNKKPQH
jgi:two-component system response regulator HydG